MVYAVGRQISWSWSRYAGGRRREGENIEKNDGRAKWWSPCIGGRLAEVVARTGSTVQANLGIILTSFSEGKHLDWLSILLSMVMISHYGMEFS